MTADTSDLLSETVSDDELSRELGVTRQTLRKWRKLGKLPPLIGPGRTPRSNRAAVRRALSGPKAA